MPVSIVPDRARAAGVFASAGLLLMSVATAGVMARDGFDIDGGWALRPATHTLRFALPAPTEEKVVPAEIHPIETSDQANVLQPAVDESRARVSNGPAATSVGTPVLRGIMAVDFNLAAEDRTGSAGRSETTAAKQIRFGHKDVGKIAVVVADDTTLMVDGHALARLLSGNQAVAKRIAAVGGDGQLSLAQLRDMGLSVRYDAVADTIDLDLAS